MNGNGFPVITRPTYAPVRMDPARQATIEPQPWADPLKPRIREINFTFPAYNGGVPEAAIQRLQISEPTLIRVSTVTSLLVPDPRIHMEIGYRRFGDTGSILTDSLWFDRFTIPTFGPYCYLKDPGEYELAIQLTVIGGGGTDMQAVLTTFTGLEEDRIDSLLQANRCHATRSSTIVLGAGGETSVTGDFWPRAKFLTIQNVGANPAMLDFGEITDYRPITAGTLTTLQTELLGKDTVVVTSVLGTTLKATVGLW